MLFNKFLKHTLSSAFTLAVGLIAFTACESKVIDLEPIANLDDQTSYTTPERCELSVIGAYDAAQCGLYNGSYSRGYPFGAASIIQGEMRGEDMNLTAEFYLVTYASTYSTATANNRFYWETSFECINRVNTVLKGIESATAEGILTTEQGNAYKAELFYLRAMTYHSLMIHFALPYNVQGNNNYGMPLYLTAINTQEEIEAALKIGRSSVEETYNQILKDLNDAEGYLTSDKLHTVNGITRASKGTIIALKTRVYLHKRDWANVVKEAAKLTNGTTAPFSSPIGGYTLTDTPEVPFVSWKNNSESIFSIENNSDDEASVNGAMAAMMSVREGGRAIITSSPTLYNSKFWLGDDKRRSLLLYREADEYYFCDKYKEVMTREEYAPIIRYSEVLLNYSEAALRTGNKALALELLNAVRNRSLANPETQAYKASDFPTDAAFMEAILWERRIEFHGEGRRWEDIHRLAADDLVPSGGIPAKIEYNNAAEKGAFAVNSPIDDAWYSASKKFIPYTDYRFIWPISFQDIVRNPTLAGQQNEGW